MATTHLTKPEVILDLQKRIWGFHNVFLEATLIADQKWELQIQTNKKVRKYNLQIERERKVYRQNYITIAQIIHITNMFKFIHTNFHIIFDFREKIRTLIKSMEDKRIDLISVLKLNLDRIINKYTYGQKKYILSALKLFRRELPKRREFIGNVLNRSFTKDIALYITDYV